MSDHLGKISFLDTPDVNGADVLTSTTLTTQLTNLVVPGTEGLTLPNGTTAQRPVTGLTGESRFNTSTGLPEIYAQGTWLPYARVIQTLSGPITNKTASVNAKTTTTIPLTSEGTQIWTTSFTPLVSGSNLVIQYTITMYHATGSRGLYTAAFVGSTAVGMSIVGTAVASSTTAYTGTYNLSLQAVYQTTSTAALTISANAGHALTTAATAVTVGVNQTLAPSNFGGAMISEWRILEII